MNVARKIVLLATIGALRGVTNLCSGSQPPVPSNPVPLTEVEAVLQDVLRTYRSGPIAERVTIRVRRPPLPDGHGPVLDRSSVVTFRAVRGARPEDRVMRADLGVLVVYMKGDSLSIVRSDDPSVCFKRNVGSSMLPRFVAMVLPPTPLPQFALVLGDDRAAANLTPYTRAVRWNLAESGPADAASIHLVGRTSGGHAALVIDRSTHRVRELSFHAVTGAVLEVRCEPIEPGDPSGWAIKTEDRRVVRSLRDLGVPETPLARGEPVGPLPVNDLATGPWSLEDEFSARATATPGRRPAPAILVLTRQRTSSVHTAPAPGSVAADAVRAYLRKQRRLAAEHDSTDERAAIPFWKPVLVFEVEEFTREALATAAILWNGSGPKVSTLFDDAEPECVWSSAGRPLLDRFVPGAEVVLAVIEPDGLLVGSIGVASTDPRDVVESRLNALFERHSREKFVGSPEPK